MENGSQRLSLRDFPVPTRVVAAVFLIAVGLGYFSALVQLHFQHASPGQFLPGPDEAAETYNGKNGMSQFVRLLTAPETRPFNGSGQMSAAFFNKGGLKNAVRVRASEKEIPLDQAQAEVRREREGERDALVAWARAEPALRKKAYDDNRFPLPDEIQAISEDFVEEKDGQKFVLVQTLLDERCVRCHAVNASGSPANFPLEKYEYISLYLEPEKNGGMSLPKLAQSTHVHALGFAMLFGLTGVIFSLTSYPLTLRLVLAPWALLFQAADLSCWWLGRVDPLYAKAIVVTGGLVAVGLVGQIVLSLFDLFDHRKGKIIVGLILLIGVAILGVIFSQVILPHLESQAAAAGAG